MSKFPTASTAFKWTATDVSGWLRSLNPGFGAYASVFEANSVDGSMLLHDVSEEYLIEWIPNESDRTSIRDSLNDLRSTALPILVSAIKKRSITAMNSGGGGAANDDDDVSRPVRSDKRPRPNDSAEGHTAEGTFESPQPLSTSGGEVNSSPAAAAVTSHHYGFGLGGVEAAGGTVSKMFGSTDLRGANITIYQNSGRVGAMGFGAMQVKYTSENPKQLMGEWIRVK